PLPRGLGRARRDGGGPAWRRVAGPGAPAPGLLRGRRRAARRGPARRGRLQRLALGGADVPAGGGALRSQYRERPACHCAPQRGWLPVHVHPGHAAVGPPLDARAHVLGRTPSAARRGRLVRHRPRRPPLPPHHHVLNYLRDGSVPLGLPRVDRLELLRELDFYGLAALYTIVGGPTVAAARMSGGGDGLWLQNLTYELACAEASDFSASTHSHRPRPSRSVYARLRYGQEYSGDWIVSSPRNLANVKYELYDACLARDPITALNKMGAAGFRPCTDPPEIPVSSRCNSDSWEIMMYKDVWQ
ncbi:unnamed protein product, partial [Prorocentrum cordatum]